MVKSRPGDYVTLRFKSQISEIDRNNLWRYNRIQTAYQMHLRNMRELVGISEGVEGTVE